MGEAQTNKPEGKHYAAALSRWLSDAKLDRLLGRNAHKALRCRLLDLIDHIGAVERWRSTLPINRQLELNYPLTVWKHWQRATVVPDPNKQPKPSAIAKLKESVATLSEEHHRLKEANGGSTITSRDSARDVVTVLRRIFSASKLEQIRKLLGKAE